MLTAASVTQSQISGRWMKSLKDWDLERLFLDWQLNSEKHSERSVVQVEPLSVKAEEWF